MCSQLTLSVCKPHDGICKKTGDFKKRKSISKDADQISTYFIHLSKVLIRLIRSELYTARDFEEMQAVKYNFILL